jgi:hypothetical protein
MTTAETTVESTDLLAEIDQQVAALERCQKQLKKPSNIPFVERNNLSTKAARSAAELKELRGQVAENSDGEAATKAREALEKASELLATLDPSNHGNQGQRPRDAGQRRPGEHGRGGPSQVRTPNRSGGD